MKLALFVILIIAITTLFTQIGLRNYRFFNNYCIWIDRIFLFKEYERIFVSSVMHANWAHFAVNMLILWLFSFPIKGVIGLFEFSTVYLIGLLTSTLLPIYLHRRYGDYKCAAGSGGVCAVIFATLILAPKAVFTVPYLSIEIPVLVVALAFMVYTLFGIKPAKVALTHEGHLAAGLIGIVVALVFKPEVIFTNYLMLLWVTLPLAFILILAIRMPEVLFLPKFKRDPQKRLTIDHFYNLSRRDKERQINELLDKINEKGFKKLTPEELDKLQELSK